MPEAMTEEQAIAELVQLDFIPGRQSTQPGSPDRSRIKAACRVLKGDPKLIAKVAAQVEKNRAAAKKPAK